MKINLAEMITCFESRIEIYFKHKNVEPDGVCQIVEVVDIGTTRTDAGADGLCDVLNCSCAVNSVKS